MEINNSPETRRIQGFRINAEVLPMLFLTGSIVEVVRGIPPGAQFRGFVIDAQTNELRVFVEHESFPETPLWHEVRFDMIHVRGFHGKELEVVKRLLDGQEKT